ncbi:MAG TPA: hypothetical protein VGC72_10885 [Candidatus Elarobacter sp.]|jgi:hypothetical protein
MRKATLTLLAGVLFLAGCGHRDDSSSSTTATQTRDSSAAASHDPCSLLTKADVEAVTHKPVADVSHVDDTHCAYGPKSGGLGVITVEAAWSGAGTQFQAGGIANSLMHDAEGAPKVGDASYATALGNLFYARKGDAYVGIDMRAAAVPVKTVGPELARRALARM